MNGAVSSCGVHSKALDIIGDDAYNKNLRMAFGRCHVRAMFPYALELLHKISRETPKLLDDFVQKRVSIDEAPEVSCTYCFAVAEKWALPMQIRLRLVSDPWLR